MAMALAFVMMRNTHGRPTLQHVFQVGTGSWAGEEYRTATICGYELAGMSRFISDSAIDALLCKRCAKKVPARATFARLPKTKPSGKLRAV